MKVSEELKKDYSNLISKETEIDLFWRAIRELEIAEKKNKELIENYISIIDFLIEHGQYIPKRHEEYYVTLKLKTK